MFGQAAREPAPLEDRRLRRVSLIAVVALGCALAACSSSDDRGSSTSTAAPRVEAFAPDDTTFYVVPDPLPRGEHGDLIRTQPVAGAPAGAVWQRIMYLSESVSGAPIAVTGVVTLPEGEPPEGGWPLVAHAHGTTGMADACAPSVSLGGSGPYAAEIVLLSGHVARDGVAVVSTDYEGLGVSGRHPYLVGESAGRSVLDSVRAARRLPGVSFDESVGIVGYSQGGGAAAWANQVAPEWTPDLQIVGVLAGAPATEIPEFLTADASKTRPLLQAREVLVAAGLATTGAQFDLETALTDAGLSVLDQLDEKCEPDLPAGRDLTRVDLTTTEPWAGAIAANVPGTARGAAPVLVVHSREDTVVPIEHDEAFVTRLCATGQTVEMRQLLEGDHVPAAIAAYEQGLAWIDGLRSGTEPRSTCR